MRIEKDILEEMIRNDMYKYRKGDVERVDKFMASDYWRKVFSSAYKKRADKCITQADWDLFIEDMCWGILMFG